MRSAELYSTQLRGADLTGADLRHARLVGTDLQGANLTDVPCHGCSGGAPLRAPWYHFEEEPLVALTFVDRMPGPDGAP